MMIVKCKECIQTWNIGNDDKAFMLIRQHRFHSKVYMKSDYGQKWTYLQFTAQEAKEETGINDPWRSSV